MDKQEKPFKLAYESIPTHSQLTTAFYATSNYSAHPLLILWWSVSKSLAIASQSGLVTSNSEITTQTAGSRTRSGCGECIYLAPRWNLKWRSRSGPAVVGQGLWSMQSIGMRHDNRILGSTVS
ncbi:hypothetical protein BASA50_000066 [Batrachochytrium salamandrivorans]|uniref:Uncharacterized protein n=1 Tax=Batrachochytrium salamandrivorans TaxID=1357716 RepID=A0ABQ8EV49_9FUNG|nr:hypothetical protein BASA60_001557 [Batrachochytrium salamandrivorans]KAH6587019.1 hypothetical protein BASA50_000066 [Batrachochytrium salamandrivorans]KAH9271570.1 hypothetical protein BASA83_006178 [Batrachochytrium salamandrivorans]